LAFCKELLSCFVWNTLIKDVHLVGNTRCKGHISKPWCCCWASQEYCLPKQSGKDGDYPRRGCIFQWKWYTSAAARASA
jgi:hypothetical protein